MKRILLLVSLFISSIAFAQITADQVDDFEDGTVQDWIVGGAAPNPPTNVADGGPDGAGDNYLEYTTTGNAGGAGSRLIVFNQDGNWNGNYTTEGIVAIKMDVAAETTDLNIRVAFQRGPNNNFTRIASTNAVTVTAGAGWSSISIPISASDFEIVDNFNGDYTIAEVLEDVSVMRILSASVNSWLGDVVTAALKVDNVEAATTLGTSNFQEINEFAISPNPSQELLNINLPSLNEVTKLQVYDILGKLVLNKELTSLNSSTNVSGWNAGVYIVKVSTDSYSQTKRFVKQ